MTARARLLGDTETPEIPTARIVVHYALTGQGKTFQTRKLYFAWPRAIALDSQIFDGSGEYPGWIARDPEELASTLDRVGTVSGRWRVSYRGDVTPELLDALSLLPCSFLLVVEEADKFMDAHTVPSGLYRMAHHGRRAGHALVLNARRPANVSRDMTACADVVRAWTLTEPADVDALRRSGFPPPGAVRLGDHDFIERARSSEGATWTLVRASGARERLDPNSWRISS